ncbi:hypothetical protein RclHR1_22370004 [Rhizophagus clarus]|uniref:Pseudouridine synthase I TruA alpha/beta domain-containing protein n=1 Tax=Rhizophagus clarus TaxID=94130 RepID=A0A2Z6RA52_9GLOM|nr:hypothetical protein RclHR1_22370004 [Rhizophagus clarus]
MNDYQRNSMKYFSILNLNILSQKIALNNIVRHYKSKFFEVKYLTNMTTPKRIKLESTNEVETTAETEKIMAPSESTEKETSISKKQDSVSSRKRFTTAKDRRDHLNKNFRNRKGNRDDDNKQQNWNNERNKIEDKGDSNESKEPRKPKKKVAVLVGFCGTGYQGMQINRDAKTIEEDLFKAFVAAGAVSKDNSDDPKKVGLMRAARTDKGVHASGNLISLKISLLPSYNKIICIIFCFNLN